MPIDLLQHLKDLSAAPGLTGYEASIRRLIEVAWQPFCDETGADKLGSFWAIQHGTAPQPRPRLMLATHMDAIGLLVSKIEGEFLRVAAVGGIDARVLPGQRVTVHGRTDLPGIVARPPSHLLPKSHADRTAPTTELLVDVGLTAADVRAQVRLGDLISFAQPARELQNNLLAAKSLDNRASVAAVSLALEQLRQRPHAWDVVAVATVQEEETLAGAAASAFALNPDLAVVIDVTFGSDSNTKDTSNRTFALGSGPTLSIGPNIHPGVYAALKAAAERLEMTVGLEPASRNSGTDAIAIQIAQAGIPTGLIGLPLRNMHTPVEIVNPKDVQRIGRLLAEFIVGLPVDFISTLKFEP